MLGRKIAIGLVRAYQRWAPARLRDACRFEPTCSDYAILAIDKYGLAVGAWTTIRRLLRCRPPNGGIDFP